MYWKYNILTTYHNNILNKNCVIYNHNYNIIHFTKIVYIRTNLDGFILLQCGLTLEQLR